MMWMTQDDDGDDGIMHGCKVDGDNDDDNVFVSNMVDASVV